MQFYPNVCPIFNIGGDEPRPQFFQVSKLSEDQKTKTGLQPKWKPFFPRIEVETCAQMHTRVKLLEGMQIEDHTQIIGGDAVKILGEVYPPSPRVSAPLNQTVHAKFNACVVL